MVVVVCVKWPHLGHTDSWRVRAGTNARRVSIYTGTRASRLNCRGVEGPRVCVSQMWPFYTTHYSSPTMSAKRSAAVACAKEDASDAKKPKKMKTPPS